MISVLVCTRKSLFSPVDKKNLLHMQVTHLKTAIEEVNREYNRMLGELESLNTIKEENIV